MKKSISISVTLDVPNEMDISLIEPTVRAAINGEQGLKVVSIAGLARMQSRVSSVDSTMILLVLRKMGGVASGSSVLGIILTDLAEFLPANMQMQCLNTWYRRLARMKQAGLVQGGVKGMPLKQQPDGDWYNVIARPTEYMAITEQGLAFAESHEGMVPQEFRDALDGINMGNAAEAVRRMGLLLQSAMDKPARAPRQPRAPRS